MALSRVGACVIVSLANPGGFHEIMPVIASGGGGKLGHFSLVILFLVFHMGAGHVGVRYGN